MDELERYGTAEHRYEGTGCLVGSDGSNTEVYFDARQVDDGAIVIGVAAVGGSIVGEASSFRGRTFSGLELRTEGPMSDVFRTFGRGDRAHFIVPQLEVAASTEATPRTIRFALYNFAFGQTRNPPIVRRHLQIGDVNLSISPVDAYESGQARLRSYGGVAHTAWCDVSRASPEHPPLSMVAAVDLLERVAPGLMVLSSWRDETVLRGSSVAAFQHSGIRSLEFT